METQLPAPELLYLQHSVELLVGPIYNSLVTGWFRNSEAVLHGFSLVIRNEWFAMCESTGRHLPLNVFIHQNEKTLREEKKSCVFFFFFPLLWSLSKMASPGRLIIEAPMFPGNAKTF